MQNNRIIIMCHEIFNYFSHLSCNFYFSLMQGDHSRRAGSCDGEPGQPSLHGGDTGIQYTGLFPVIQEG